MLRPKSVDSSSETFVGSDSARQTSHNANGDSPDSLPPGTLVCERYEIISLLGTGGMGAVYKANDIELDRLVAIKVIRPELAKDVEVLRRFKQELILARQVSHRSVVRIYDIGEDEGMKFISMQYVEGKDLSSVIKEQGAFEPEAAANILRQICQGLEAAHAEHVIHRDLKPQNIMLGSDGRVHVMDFGIARSLETHGMTQTGSVLGTMEYMSPEQAKGEPVDQRSDLYSVGLIFFELLTGTLAFDADTPLGSLYRRIQEPPPAPCIKRRDLPQALNAIALRLLQTKPEQRYQSASEVIKDLSDWGAHSTVVQLKQSPAFKWRSRVVPWKIAFAALFLLGTLSLAGWLKWRSGSPPTHSAKSMKVLLADFENRTNDPVFAGTLEPTMSLALEGAPFISVFNRGQARKIAQQLKPGTDAMDKSLTRLIAAREGVEVVISGSIEPYSGGYRVTARAVDSVTGKLIREQELIAGNKEDVLLTVSNVAASLRNALGDSTPPSLQLAAAETFTSNSLEAAHEYAEAQEFQWAGKTTEAIAHYKAAVQFDPNLGRAHAGLAVAYSNLKQRKQAEQHYGSAMALLDRMSERERYRTLGAYYLTYVNNYPKAIETYRKLVELYPSDSAGHNNLSIAYVFMLQMPEAVKAVRQALEINSGNLQHRLNYALYSMYAADFDTAIDQSKQIIAQNPDYEFAYLPLAISSLVRGDEASAVDAYARLERTNDHGRSLSQIGLADLHMYRGRYREAIIVLKKGIAADEQAKLTGELAQKYVALAQAELALGRRASAVQAAKKAIATDSSESVVVPAALVFVESGDLGSAATEAKKLETKLQEQAQSSGHIIQAMIAFQRERYSQSVAELQAAQKQRDSWLARFLLARTYIAAGHFAEGMSEIEVCEKRRGESTDLFLADTATVRSLPPLYYWKAKAQEGMGQAKAAEESYSAYSAIRAQSGEDGLAKATLD